MCFSMVFWAKLWSDPQSGLCQHTPEQIHQWGLATPAKFRRSSLPDELLADKIEESVERITNRSVPHPLPHAPMKLAVLDEPGGVTGYDTTFCRPGPSLLAPVHLPFKASPAVCSQLLYLGIKSLWNTSICSYTLPKVIPDCRGAKWFAKTHIKKTAHFFFCRGTKKGQTWPSEFFYKDKLCHRD